nr:ORF33 [Bracoviriform inaniti]
MSVRVCTNRYRADYNSQSHLKGKSEDLRSDYILIKEILEMMEEVKFELKKSLRQIESQLKNDENTKPS